ncbi:hypothetical protein UPYG_G00283880 [Umbra pygmaea]|uniref:Fork-head domain-containing protein n=1 Tax=Umbra pygmaea TaxID=75934 RepID=A0ABD0W809_UMBPY
MSQKLLRAEPPQQCDELPGDLSSLSWLTTVDIARLQQLALDRDAVKNTGPQICGQLHTDQQSNRNTVLGHDTMSPPPNNMQNSVAGINYYNNCTGNMAGYTASGYPGSDVSALGYPGGDVSASGYPESDLSASRYPGIYVSASGYLESDALDSGYPGGGVSTSSYQSTPPSCFSSPQQVYSSAQAIQQHSPSSMYSSIFYHNTSVYEQQAAAMKHPSRQDLPTAFPKPIYSYSCLIAMALKNSRTGSLPVSEIYSFMKEQFPYFKTAADGWKNSVRHNLSLNKCFVKVENKQAGSTTSNRKGCLWALNPAKVPKMEEEMQKWKRKDLGAIRRSMANPDDLDKLITDRPGGCQSKPCGSMMMCIPSSACPPPLPGHPHFQAQTHTCLGEPISPVPARTPPLHADCSHNTFLQHGSHRTPHTLYSVHPAATADVALNHNIREFTGSLWEEVRDGGLMCLSDSEVAGLYNAFSSMDTAPAVPYHYIPSTQFEGQDTALL